MWTCTALTPSSGIEPPRNTRAFLAPSYGIEPYSLFAIGLLLVYIFKISGTGSSQVPPYRSHGLQFKEGYHTQSLPEVLTLPLFSVPLAGNIMKGDPLKMNLLRRHLIRCDKLRVISFHETRKCSPCFLTVLIITKQHCPTTTTYSVYMVIVYADVISIYID